MPSTIERPFVLHLFTPGPQASPFDVNMAADAGYQLIVPYTGVALDGVPGLTQDAIFSRGPKGVRRTAIFIGGRDVLLAADMLQSAQAAMVPPFAVSLIADPSGAYTTAAAMLACVEAALQRGRSSGGGDGGGSGGVDHSALAGCRVLVLGGTGPVGRIAGVLAAQAGALVQLSSRGGRAAAQQAARQTGERFGVDLEGVSGADSAALRASLVSADVVLACAAAGVQVLSADDLAFAPRLQVAADVNAVPPAGIAGVGVMHNGQPLPGTSAVGIGALAVGNVKYQTQHQLLQQMRLAPGALTLGFAEAFALARSVLAESAA